MSHHPHRPLGTRLTPTVSQDAVVVIPGIMGSELIDTTMGQRIWGLDPRWYARAWASGKPLQALMLTDDERAGRTGRVQATGLLRFPAFAPVLAGFEPYTTLVKRIHGAVASPAAVLEFAYDWRLPVEHNARLLATAAVEHLGRWRADPVHEAARKMRPDGRRAQLVLVAHSMGGLLCRALSLISGATDDVRATVTLGTPFDGAAKAAVLLNSGRGGPVPLPRRRLRRLAATLPGLHDLLPTYRCIDEGNDVRRLTPADIAALGGDAELARAAQDSQARLAEILLIGHRAMIGIEQPTVQSLKLRDGVIRELHHSFWVHSNGELVRDADRIPCQGNRGGDGTVPLNSAEPRGAEPLPLPQQHGPLAQADEAISFVCVSGKGATTLGRFTAALDEALHGSFLGASKIELWQLGGELKRKLDGGQVIPKDIEHEVLRRVVAPMAAPAPLDVFAELKRVLAGLTEDERGHFVPKAQGAELGEPWWYFQGRRVESGRLAGWLRSARAGLLVVTGRAGSGKSALLGHSVVQSRPVVRAVLARHGLADELPPDDRPPDDVFDAVLHLAGLTSVEVTRRLAEDLHLPELKPEAELPEQVEALRSGIKRGMKTRTILVDALDEAVAPVTIARAVLRPLAALQNLRVVVGTRRSTREDPDKGEPDDQDLLDALGAADDEIVVERDSAAITAYVRQRLNTAISRGMLVADDDVVRNVGADIGTSGQEFLFARLAVHEILAQPALLTGPGLSELVSSDHKGLFARAVSRLEAERAANAPLLAALAFARGRGVPMRDGVWATVASALSGGPVITDAEIGDLRKVAAPYVMLDREHSQSVYRLAHRTFAEHFTHELDETSDAQEEGRHRHQDILRGLVAEVTHSPAIGLNPYLSSYLSAHAGAAGREGWQYLADHPDVLHRLDPEAVSADVMRTAFGRVELPPEITGMVGVRDLLSKGTVTDHPGLRQLATARCYTGVRQARTDPRMPDGAEWAVRWADLVQQPLHVTLTRHRRQDGGVWAVTAVPGPGGRTLLATGGGDGRVRLWDPATCTEVGEPPRGGTSHVTAVTAVPGPGGRTLLASASRDGTVRLWDPTTGTETGQPLSGHTSGATALAAVPGRGGHILLAFDGGDGTVRLWDPTTGTETGQPLSGHTSRVMAIATLPGPGGRTLLASGSEDGTVRLWDPTTGTEMSKPLRGQARSVDAVAAVPGPGGRTLLATGGEDGVVRLWDPTIGTEMGQPLSGHTSGVTVVAALPGPSGRTLLASGSRDGTVRLWDPTSVATGGSNATARRWDRRWLSRRPLASHAGEVRAVAAVPGPDGQKLLASGGSDGTVRLWDPTSGTPIGQPLTGHIDHVKGIVAVIGSGGRPLIASCSDDGTVRLWDPATGRCIRRRPTDDAGSVNAVATVSVSSGRALLAAGYGDGRVRLWDGRKRRSRRSLAGHAGQVYAVAAVGGPDGQTLLASGGEEGTVRLWNPANGTAVGDPMTGHTDQVNGVVGVPGPSGRSLLASGSSDRTVRLWEATGTQVGQPLTGHAGGVNAVAALLCSDGRTLLASGSSDGTVRLWDPATGALVTVLAVGMIVWAISPMPGGHLAIGTGEGIAVLRVRELLSG